MMMNMMGEKILNFFNIRKKTSAPATSRLSLLSTTLSLSSLSIFTFESNQKLVLNFAKENFQPSYVIEECTALAELNYQRLLGKCKVTFIFSEDCQLTNLKANETKLSVRRHDITNKRTSKSFSFDKRLFVNNAKSEFLEKIFHIVSSSSS